jgi:hypothetical protein
MTQNRNRSGGNQPQYRKVDCPQCGEETNGNKTYCAECGKSLKVVCGNPVCKKTVANTKKCGSCGHDLQKVAAKSTGKTLWEIEVQSAGKNGKYNLRVQATKDGVGKTLSICVTTIGNVLSVGTGKARVISNDLLTRGDTPVDIVSTNNKGLLICDIEFTSKSMELAFAIVGCQADVEKITLWGPPLNIPARAGFRGAGRIIKQRHRRK